MNFKPNGELVPTGGGDNIPLLRERLTIGRRETCDVCLRLPNISGLHCELQFRDGYWYIRDLNSKNGVKVNGQRVKEKLLHPRDELSIGKRLYKVIYEAPSAARQNEEEDDIQDVFNQSLMEKAGLERPKKTEPKRRMLDATDYIRELEDED